MFFCVMLATGATLKIEIKHIHEVIQPTITPVPETKPEEEILSPEHFMKKFNMDWSGLEDDEK